MTDDEDKSGTNEPLHSQDTWKMSRRMPVLFGCCSWGRPMARKARSDPKVNPGSIAIVAAKA